MSIIYNKEQQEAIDQIDSLIETHQYELAGIKCVEYEHKFEKIINNPEELFFQVKIAGFLIDSSYGNRNADYAIKGINILNRYIDLKLRKESFNDSQYYFSIANGYHALYELYSITKQSLFDEEEVIPNLRAARDYFWKAYKSGDKESSGITPNILINLGNCLSDCGRIVEAIHYYDKALLFDLKFHSTGMHSRSNALLKLQQSTSSLNLTWQIVNGFKKSIELGNLNPILKKRAEDLIIFYEKQLLEANYSFEKAKGEIDEINEEFSHYPNYTKFCLNESLILNEHSLYCKCSGSLKDNLSISASVITGDFVPKFEHIVNRLKSEFCFARAIYYNAVKDSSFMNDFNDNISFFELEENELLSNRVEALRQSFKICYAILDKIAGGVSYLFELYELQESNLFENFWKKKPEVWKKIKVHFESNYYLFALYNVACDLNGKGQGEWKNFKDWRNKLEHGFFSVRGNNTSTNLYGIISENNLIFSVSEKDFKEQTLRLLQLCRACIFYFTWCVRVEGFKETGKIAKDEKYGIITLERKLTDNL